MATESRDPNVLQLNLMKRNTSVLRGRIDSDSSRLLPFFAFGLPFQSPYRLFRVLHIDLGKLHSSSCRKRDRHESQTWPRFARTSRYILVGPVLGRLVSKQLKLGYLRELV